jgi:hypothetical protein
MRFTGNSSLDKNSCLSSIEEMVCIEEDVSMNAWIGEDNSYGLLLVMRNTTED